MEYRIKYIFKGTKDKGYEIADCHGTYMSYEIVQEQEMPFPHEYEKEGFEFPVLPYIDYQKYNKDNSQMRGKARVDVTHTELPVLDKIIADDCGMENFPFTDAVWIEREEPQIEPNLEEDKLPLVGTELANFLNFDIDRFMNGGYRLLWEEGEDERGSHIIGWKKTEGFDLSKLYIRQAVNSYSVMGNQEVGDGLRESIPFFIRMFGCSFINKEKWEYDLEEVQKIKDLQERLKAFCQKVFFPKDKNDKRKNSERYCQEIEEISRKKLQSMIPGDWFTPSSLEQALAIECYAMIKGNVNFFICENCGMYTVSDDKRSRLCSRLYYDGYSLCNGLYRDESGHEKEGLFSREYWYTCKEQKYQWNVICKGKSDIIENITQHERKRLYHHVMDNMSQDYNDLIEGLVNDFYVIVNQYKEEYQNKISSAETEDQMKQIANDYLKLIAEGMDAAILKRKGILREAYKFGKKKNREITSLQGEIFK